MPIYVGIDVSKFKHTCCIIDEEGEIIEKSFDFPNSKEGFDSLIKTFQKIGDINLFQIVMEATGHYHECLFRYLVANNYQVQIKLDNQNQAKNENMLKNNISLFIN